MYSRILTPPNHSFFLFGPRGTGKTTWLREKIPNALWFNLLRDADFLPLLGDAALFRKRVLSLSDGGWVVVDEVQKLPALLNEVHDLISLHEKFYLFALSGSSARRLRRLDVNLLAGRALDRKFFPLTQQELGEEFDVNEVLSYGCLPLVWADREYARDLLESYVGTYLREEIQQEALVENLESFGRFLKVAAIMNGNVIEIASIARDCGVARKTVERYFETLVDTLVAFFLPAWRPRLKVREAGKRKFYFFDPGVVRTLAGRIRTPLSDLERGPLFETYLLHELRAANSYLSLGGELSYYSGANRESDVIFSQGDTHIAMEFKAGTSWRRDYGKTLRSLYDAQKVSKVYGVYTGESALRDGPIEVLPVERFLDILWTGDFLPSLSPSIN